MAWGTNLCYSIDAERRQVRELFQAVQPHAQEAGISEEEFLWGYTAYTSRALPQRVILPPS
jgi:hypothetical protein